MLLTNIVVEKIESYYSAKIDKHIRVSIDYRETTTVEKWHIKLRGEISKTLYLKEYRKDYYPDVSIICEKEFNSANLYKDFQSKSGDLKVVTPIFMVSSIGVLASEEAPGQDLYSLTNSLFHRFLKGSNLIQTYYSSGKGLLEFHSSTKKKATFNFLELKDYINIRLNKLDSALFTKNEHSTVEGYIQGLGEKLDGKTVTNTGIHGDYIPPNLIANNNQLYLLDFSQHRTDTDIDEVCYFIVFCYFQGFKLNRHYWNQLGQAFLNGYSLPLKEHTHEFIELFCLKHLLNCLAKTNNRINNTKYQPIKKAHLSWQYRHIKQSILNICAGKGKDRILNYNFTVN